MSVTGLTVDYLDLLDAFAAEGVIHLVVGGFALAGHGVTRATVDLDVWVRPDPDNAQRVFRGLLRFGAPLEEHGVQASDFAREGIVYQLGLPPCRIDVLTRIDGVAFDDAWPDRVFLPMEGRSVPALGLSALVQAKRAAGREKDLLDLLLLRKAGVRIDP